MKLTIPLTLSRAVTPSGVVFAFLSGCANYVYRLDPADPEGWQPIPFEAYRPEMLPAGTEFDGRVL